MIVIDTYTVRWAHSEQVFFTLSMQRGLSRRASLPVVAVGNRQATYRARHDGASLLRWARADAAHGYTTIERTRESRP